MNKKTLQFIQHVPGWLEMNETLFLEKAVKKTENLKGEIVEIGSFCGKSTISLAQGKGTVYAIDPHKGFVEKGNKHPATYKAFIRNLKTAGVFNKVKPLVKTSKEASAKWRNNIRFLFIDGLHDEINAKRDFVLWSPYLVTEGIVAIHDSFCRWSGSEKIAIQKVVLSSDFYRIGVVDSIIYGIKGHGSIGQKFDKLIWQIYIISAIHLNHILIIIRNLPEFISRIKLISIKTI